MNQKERDELLIRIDQKVIAIEKVMFDKPTYPTIKEKVLTHSKIIWGIFFLSIAAVFKSFWK